MSKIASRPLDTIIDSLNTDKKPIDLKTAEEAVAAVAADGVISTGEGNMLAPFAGDQFIATPEPFRTWPTLKQGTVTGQALFFGLAQVADGKTWISRGNRHAEKLQPGQLLQEARKEGLAMIQTNIYNLTGKYHKAWEPRVSSAPDLMKPPLQAKVDELTAKWLNGTLPDGDPAQLLKPYLEANYR